MATEKEKVDVTPNESKNVENENKVTIVSGSEYWVFEDNPIFIGTYTGREHWGKKKDKETGKVIESIMGFYFEDEDGEEWILSNSHSIEKTLNTEYNGKLLKDSDYVFEFEFKGKTEANGQPFNRFKTSIYDKKKK